ncbi:anti-sigma factor family protein [Trinickia dinghuensis]|uniref:Anti-sigma factor n=1 Tax=Trinickia dinghuensis TaxID=2291023 RepID=A0A3D8JVH1_9BURK|nr:anti-sigma factor [Trinickia dinghuensis]RDU96850.1 anti-sigma factor [Trinickia dinghuensis]
MSDDRERGDHTPTEGFTERDLDRLSAFVDGELPEADRQCVAERLAADPQTAQRVTHYRAQRAALRALFADPAAQTSGPFVVLRVRPPWWRQAALVLGSLAAGAALAWFAGAVSSLVAPPSMQTTAFARQADLAYAVYAPEQRHVVEVAATSEGTLVGWLSKRLNRPLSIPSLEEYGYAFLGGRLLPGPAAQFMYQGPKGQRLALYVSPAPQRESAVRLLQQGDRRTFYWTNGQTAYALSGEIAEDKLHEIAVDVCGDLGGHPDLWK